MKPSMQKHKKLVGKTLAVLIAEQKYPLFMAASLLSHSMAICKSQLNFYLTRFCFLKGTSISVVSDCAPYTFCNLFC